MKQGVALKNRFIAFLIVLLFCTLTVASSSPSGLRVSAQSTPTALSLGETATPPVATLNPLDPSSNTHLPTMIYDWLFSVNFPPLPFITPIMAQGYSVNANNTQWTISLRPNLKWSNGTPLNSTDLWYSMFLWNVTGLFGSIPVNNFSIINATSVKVLTQAGNFILYDLVYSGFAVLPYQTFSKVNASSVSSFTNENNVVADGAFVLQNYSAGQNPIILTANPYYWQGTPHFQTLQYYLYSSLAAELNAYEAGQIDAYESGGPYSAYQPIANLSGHTVVGPPLATPGITMGVLFNDWAYPFNNSSVRRALAFGTNVSAINNALNGPFASAALPNQDNLLPAYNQQIGFNATGPRGYSYDPNAAKQLFQQVGFKYSGTTLEYTNGTAVVFSAFYDSVKPWAASSATLLETQWAQIGIKLTLTAEASSTINNYGAQPNPVGWQILVQDVSPGFLNNWGVTPGPGIIQDLGTYEAPLNGSYSFWNSTYAQAYARLRTDVVNSSQFNNDSRTCANINAFEVPVIPLFNEYNIPAISNSIYWGSASNYTGIYNTQAEIGVVYWDESLYLATPTATSTSQSTSIASTSSTRTSSSSVPAPISSSTGSSTSSLGLTSTTSSTPVISTSSLLLTTSTSSASGGSNTLAYAIIAVVIILIVLAALISAMRRRSRKATDAE